MSDRFRRFERAQWPNANVRREAPVILRLGDRTLYGRLDVVVETPEAIVIIDHKSLPGGRAQWLDQARKNAGQLKTYGDAVRAATSPSKPVRKALHLPIAGEILFVE